MSNLELIEYAARITEAKKEINLDGKMPWYAPATWVVGVGLTDLQKSLSIPCSDDESVRALHTTAMWLRARLADVAKNRKPLIYKSLNYFLLPDEERVEHILHMEMIGQLAITAFAATRAEFNIFVKQHVQKKLPELLE